MHTVPAVCMLLLQRLLQCAAHVDMQDCTAHRTDQHVEAYQDSTSSDFRPKLQPTQPMPQILIEQDMG